AWISENGDTYIKQNLFKQKCTNPIEVKESITAEEQENYTTIGIYELQKSKVLKPVARRVE
ncbi:MAG: GIY-YIG nuclease family protein, partial [Dolichospermum sp.]